MASTTNIAVTALKPKRAASIRRERVAPPEAADPSPRRRFFDGLDPQQRTRETVSLGLSTRAPSGYRGQAYPSSGTGARCVWVPKEQADR
jgi:hypothetical protein